MPKKCKVRITYSMDGKVLSYGLCGEPIAKGATRCAKHEEMAKAIKE